MNDKELLELAAKAAGVAGVFVEAHGPYIGQDAAGIGRPGARYGDHLWNPLDDDGAALRLAVDLQFDLLLGHRGAIVESCGGRIIAEELCHADSGEDLACARRAIVRAAAEIGKSMV